MAARKFVGAFVLLVLEFETANACCIEMRNDTRRAVNSWCYYNETMCRAGTDPMWCTLEQVCVENNMCAPSNYTASQLECVRLEACNVTSTTNMIRDDMSSDALANTCVNVSKALLKVCKQPDGLPDTLVEDCFRSCGPLKASKRSPMRLSGVECGEIEREFCHRPGRGRSCTDRCIQNAKNSCRSLIKNILRGNFTRDDVAASAEALRFYPRFLSNSSIDLDEVVGSVNSFHRALKRQQRRALEYYNETETIEELVDVYDNLLGDDLRHVWTQQDKMSGLGPMLLQSLENAKELFAKSAQMTSKGCRLNITRTNIEMDVDCSNQEHYRRSLPLSVSGELVFTSFDLPLQRSQSPTEENGCMSASVTRYLDEYINFNSSDFNHFSPAPNTPLLSIYVNGRSIPDGQKAYLYFSRSQMANSTVENITCVFWNFTKQDWTALPVEWNDTHFICSTSHLTSFAILVTVTGTETVDASHALTIISYIGCGVSIICLLATILTLLILRKKLNKGVLLYIHLNFAVALLASLIVFVAGIETANHIGWLCTLVAALLHYLFLCVFCWMLAEGIMLYLLVVRVFGTAAEKWYYLLILGWGFPILIVAISAGVRHVDYGTKNYCWLSTRKGVIWAFVAPILAIIMVNIIILVMTVTSIVKTKAKFSTERENKKIALLKTAIKSAIVLLPLLGLTWAFGLLAVNRNTTVFAWLFTIFNSLQGLFVFILHVLRNEYVLSKAKIILKLFHLQKHPASSKVVTSIEMLPAEELIKTGNVMDVDSVTAISQKNISISIDNVTAISQEYN